MVKLPSKTEYVINTLSKNGFEAYIVGGCVRDMLMGKTPHDFDITTNALPETVMELFQKTVPTGIAHGTVTVIIENTPIEVTTYRTEGNYLNNRRPESVKFVSTLKEDLSRRDFTVNALAYNDTCGLVDYFDGKKDLENKFLRTVGNPKDRFSEDALRILRLFRFSSVLDFEIENSTLECAIETAHLLQNISKERIFSELFKSCCGENPTILSKLVSTDSLSFLGISKNADYSLLKKLNRNPDLCFFAFLYLSTCNPIKTLKILKAPNKLLKFAEQLLFLLSKPISKEKTEIKLLLCNTEKSVFNDYLLLLNALGEDIRLTKQLFDGILENDEPYLISHLKIDGEILKKLGFGGAQIGEVLKFLQGEVIKTPHNNTTEILTEKALKKLP